MKRSAALSALLVLSACMAPQPKPIQVVNPDWVPEKGVEWAIADCNAKSAGISGYDWIDAASKKTEARLACLKAYGLRP